MSAALERNVLTARVSMVRSALDTKTEGTTVQAVLTAIRAGRWKSQVEAVRKAYYEGGKSAADELKRRLPAVLFSGTFSRRAKDGLIQHSGILCLDCDGLNGRLEAARLEIEKDPHTLAAFLSPSGTGLKVLVPIDGNNHEGGFYSAQSYFREQFGIEIDPSCRDVSRLCFVSYDPQVLVRTDAVTLPIIEAPSIATHPPPTSSPPRADLIPYAKRALEDEAQAVAQTPEGGRNARLNQAAFNIGQLVAAGLLSEAETNAKLLQAALASGLGESEAKRTIESGLRSGMEHPRTIPERPRANTGEANTNLPARKTSSWPNAPNPACYYGLPGEIVKAIEPHTESDPIALLVQLLVFFGNVIERAPHFKVEADRHGMNEFVLLVGETSKGRKGSSVGQIRRLFEKIDHDWETQRIASGLSSGEGLVWAVRDPITKETKNCDPEIIDPGENDKRLLVLESEFASVLQNIERQGNTLSPVIRNLWDTGSVRILTKNSPARTTEAHVSIIGHITRDELLRCLGRSELANGFANRFLFVAVRRSKYLPEGGNLTDEILSPLIERLTEAIRFARTVGEIRRDHEARDLWHKVYQKLSEGKPGLLGGILSRAEAHTMRLASLYALMDRSDIIRFEHLTAALALWEYVEESAAWIFGDSIGDPQADAILRQLRLRPDGMTRTEMSELFGRHAKKEKIERALKILTREGFARHEFVKTDGRSVERWFAL